MVSLCLCLGRILSSGLLEVEPPMLPLSVGDDGVLELELISMSFILEVSGLSMEERTSESAGNKISYNEMD